MLNIVLLLIPLSLASSSKAAESKFTHDVAIDSVVSPIGIVKKDSTIIPEVIVTNNGTSIESFDVIFEINHLGNDFYKDTVTVMDLSPGETTHVYFDPFTPYFSSSAWSIFTYTALSVDENTSNDAVFRYQIVADCVIHFDSSNGGFTPDPPAGGWEWGTPTYRPAQVVSGENAWGTVLDGNYADLSDLTLYSISFYAEYDNPELVFCNWYNTEENVDGGNVEISIDGGNTWSLIQPTNGYPCNSVAALGDLPGYSGISEGWEYAFFSLDGIAQGTYFKIRFHFASDTSGSFPGWFIDNIGLINATVPVEEDSKNRASNIELSFNTIYIERDRLHIYFEIHRKENITITMYNGVGRVIKEIPSGTVGPGAHKSSIKVGDLRNGLYFLTVKVGDVLISRKVLILK